MLTLALDASTYLGTVAVVRSGQVLASTSATMRGEREERLMPAVVETLRLAGVGIDELERVACGEGPGSFTSLRIAGSIAKGIALARGLPLYGAPSPLLIVAGATPPLAPGSYCAVLDAMRGDLYGLDVEISAGGGISPRGGIWLLPRADAEERAVREGARLLGPVESPSRGPDARGFAILLEGGLCREVSLAEWEPAYGRKAEAQVRWEQAHGRPLETK